MRQLSTTEINEHFGITMSAVFITDTLKVAADAKIKRATLWNEDRLAEIGSALAAHATARGAVAPGAADAGDNSDLF